MTKHLSLECPDLLNSETEAYEYARTRVESYGILPESLGASIYSFSDCRPQDYSYWRFTGCLEGSGVTVHMFVYRDRRTIVEPAIYPPIRENEVKMSEEP